MHQKGELKLRVQDDEVTFNVFKSMRHPIESDACFLVETVEAIVSSQSGPTDPLEASLVQSDSENLSEEAAKYVNWMNSFKLNGRKYYEPLGENTQIAIAFEDQEKTTFTCPYGTFAFRRMPFRLCNAPNTFQCCMMAIFSDMVEKTIEVFMDDFSVLGSSFDDRLENL